MPIEEEPTAIAEADELVHVPQVDEDSDNASDVFTEQDEEAVEMARTFLKRLHGEPDLRTPLEVEAAYYTEHETLLTPTQ